MPEARERLLENEPSEEQPVPVLLRLLGRVKAPLALEPCSSSTGRPPRWTRGGPVRPVSQSTSRCEKGWLSAASLHIGAEANPTPNEAKHSLGGAGCSQMQWIITSGWWQVGIC